MANTTEDGWEYEYEDNETEDFFVAVDLANVPEPQKSANDIPRAGHPVLLKSRLRADNERRQAEITSNVLPNESASVGEIQINGLHTANPLIRYNDQLLSCKWAGNVGTDMFFAKPHPDAEENALRSLPGVDLIAMSSAKLVANAARLRPKDDLFEGAGDERHVVESTDSSGSSQDADVVEARPAPSTFLEKLNAAKARRGDRSELIISKEATVTRLRTRPRIEEPSEFVGQDDGIEDTVMVGA
jgi:hypothetical protein